MFLPLSFLFLLLPALSHATPDVPVIDVPNVGPWGAWGDIQMCPQDYVATGFALKIQENQGYGDDTAVNGIRLYCCPLNGNIPQTLITSSEGPWGIWTAPIFCSNGYLVSFSMTVEPRQGSGDATSVNNFKFNCSSGQEELEGVGLPWGSYGPQSASCLLGICGMQTKVEISGAEMIQLSMMLSSTVV